MNWLSALMSWEWTKIAAGLGVAGVLAGVSKSVADHLLGDRKERTAYRRAKIAEWRNTIHTVEWGDLGNTPAYSEIRPYIPGDVLREIEHPRIVMIPGGRGGDPRKQHLLDAISLQEKAWNLI